MNISKSYTYTLLVCGLVGLLAAFLLTIDTIKLSKDPTLNLPCNINPFISCSSVIGSQQGAVFGFPNPLLGIAGFSAITTLAVLIILGASPDRRFWKIFMIGITLAIVFVHWFIYQSIYVLGSLCLYCMVTWTVTWPIFLYTAKNFFQNNRLLDRNHLAILVCWYLLVILLILIRFREFFIT